MKTKEIIVVTNSMGNGGAQRVLSELIEEWSKNSIKISVIQFDKHEKSYNYELHDADLIQLESKYKLFLFAFIEKEIQLINYVKKRKNAILMGFVNQSILFIGISSFFVSNKIVFSDRNDPNNCPNTRFKRFIRNILFKRADLVVFQTEDALNYHRINNGINGPIIVNPINKHLPKVNSKNRNKTFISSARLDKQKNFSMLIKAFYLLNKDYPEYQLDIYGRGEQESAIKNMISELELNNSIFLKGYCNNIFEIMNNSFAYVSSSDYEGISNSMLEAMALGMPVICTDCPIGGARMMIEDKINGLLVKVNDEVDMYLAMKKIVENDEFRNKIATEASKIRNKYPIEKIANIWIEEIDKII